ncbi:MAG: helix-turn-helix domain-containing protein [Candidatus Heimdallarchaeaceae archaeon]
MNYSKIKELRKANKLSQVELARRVGVSITSVQLWEKGGMNPNEENLIKLKKVLNVKAGD